MFTDRNQAGEALADKLALLGLDNPLVLALPRGGVPVALPVARRLNAPLDLLMVRKIGMPGQPELAIGAVVDGAQHDVVFNPEMLRSIGRSENDFAAAISRKLNEIETRRNLYLAGREPEPVAGRSVIVVDDGIATGATVSAALKALGRRSPALVLLAVPVAPRETLAELRGQVDQAICLETPSPFYSVGAYYHDFNQVDDAAVQKMLRSIWDAESEGK